MKMINQRLEVESDNPDLLILRARLHLIFSKVTLLYLITTRLLIMCNMAIIVLPGFK